MHTYNNTTTCKIQWLSIEYSVQYMTVNNCLHFTNIVNENRKIILIFNVSDDKLLKFFSSRYGIFHSYRDVTIANKGLLVFGPCLWRLSNEEYLTCYTC